MSDLGEKPRTSWHAVALCYPVWQANKQKTITPSDSQLVPMHKDTATAENKRGNVISVDYAIYIAA